MAYDYEEEQRLKKELEQRAAARRQQEAQSQAAAAAAAPPPKRTPAQVAKTTPEPAPNRQQDGLVTSIGNALDYVVKGDYISDAVNAVAAGINQITPEDSPLKQTTQSWDDKVLSSGELNQKLEAQSRQRQQSENPVVRGIEGVNTGLEAVSSGMRAGMALPMTIGARLTGQNSPWDEAPALVKENAIANTIFQIGKVVVPTLLTGGVAGGYGLATGTALGLAGESAVETATQDSADDLIAGRQFATLIGDVANHLGFNGAQLTEEMIEGKTPTGQALTAVVGFLQNFGINVAADQLIKKAAAPAINFVRRFIPTKPTLAQEYVQSLASTKSSNPKQYWSVDQVDLDSAVQGHVIKVEGGYGLVAPDGDIKGLFKLPNANRKGVADEILQEAIRQGGIKLDNFDGYLTKIYERNGFRPVARVPFNEEYAPPGWDPAIHKKDDVVAMIYDPEKRLKINLLKTADYEEAIRYRDSLVPYAQNNQLVQPVGLNPDVDAPKLNEWAKGRLATQEVAGTLEALKKATIPDQIKFYQEAPSGVGVREAMSVQAQLQIGVKATKWTELPNQTRIRWDFRFDDDFNKSLGFPEEVKFLTVEWNQFAPQELFGSAGRTLRAGGELGQYGRYALSDFNRIAREELPPGTILANSPATDLYSDSGPSIAQRRRNEAGIDSRESSVRARIYQRAGFSDIDETGWQFAIVRANPDERGRWLEPLNLERVKNVEEDPWTQSWDASRQLWVNNTIDDWGLEPEAAELAWEKLGNRFQEEVVRQDIMMGRVPNPDMATDGEELANLEDVLDRIRSIRSEPRATVELQAPVTNQQAYNRAGEILEDSPENIRDAVDDVNEPRFSEVTEPHDVQDVDSAVPVSRPSIGNEYVSEEALVLEALRDAGIASDGLTNADRAYFTNWNAVVNEESMQTILQEATKTLKKLRGFPEDLQAATSRVLEWWKHNGDLLDDNIDEVAKSFQKAFTRSTNDDLVANLDTTSAGGIATALREYGAVTKEGFLAATLMAEELGVRIQKQARVLMNLETAEIDFTKPVELFLDLHDRANLFLTPLRRGKRIWATEGVMQQRKALKALRNADVQGSTTPEVKPPLNPTAKDIESIRWSEVDTGRTIRELWGDAVAGDQDALTLFKQYASYIAYTDPRTALTQTETLGKAIKEARLKGLNDAISSLFYAFRLSRPRTQLASLAGNIGQLVLEPVGAVWSGEGAYGIGRLYGGVAHLSGAITDMTRAFKMNRPLLDGTTRFADEVVTHAQRAIEIEDSHKMAVQNLNLNKAGPAAHIAEFITYKLEELANNPLVGGPGRFLLAQDEGAKSVLASQIAMGRAFERASKQGWQNVQRLVKEEFDKVFADGLKRGKIIDADVLDAARNITFQADIPSQSKQQGMFTVQNKDSIDNGLIGNMIDSAFLNLKEAADESAIFRFFSPFTRMSYNALEKGGVFMAGMMSPPIPGMAAKGGPDVLQALFPRYKAIMNGELGETARIQLKSQFALAQMVTLMGVTWAASGGMTGVNTENMPKQSFIIPAPNTETGYVAIPFSRLEPFSTILTPIADAVNGFRDEILTRGDYERFVTEMTFTLGMSTLDKSFLLGLTNATEILDVKNMDASRAQGLASSLAALAIPSVAPAIGQMFAPYFTASKDEGDMASTFIAKFNQRSLGGVGLPEIYDELTGKPRPRVASLAKTENYWAHVGASLLNEFVWPGAITPVDPKDKIKQKLDEIGFKIKPEDSYRQFKGYNLTLEEQSQLSKAMHDHGNYREKLEEYFFGDSAFKSKWQLFQRARQSEGGRIKGKTRNPELILESIHQDIRRIRNQSKQEAFKHLASTNSNILLKKQYEDLANMLN